MRGEATGESFVRGFAGAAVGGGQTEGVRGGEGRGGDVVSDGLGVGPGAGSLFAGDVLDDFVEDGGEDEGGGFVRVRGGGVAFVGEVGADGDEEGAALGYRQLVISRAKVHETMGKVIHTNSPSLSHSLKTSPISSIPIPIPLITPHASDIPLIIPCSIPLCIIFT